MTDTTAERKAVRERITRQRRDLGAGERMRAAQGLRRSLEKLPEFLVDACIAGYWAHAGELPLNIAVAPLAERGQQLHLPVISPDRHLRFARWCTGDAVEPNRYGIPEPSERDGALAPEHLDVVLVPLVAFDRRGNRIGFGGGYYDASFAFLKQRQRPAVPLLVGIGYAFQELPAIEAQVWDVALDYIATERELIDCTQAEQSTQ